MCGGTVRCPRRLGGGREGEGRYAAGRGEGWSWRTCDHYINPWKGGTTERVYIRQKVIRNTLKLLEDWCTLVSEKYDIYI